MKLIHVHGFAELAPESLITEEYRKYTKKLGWKLAIQEFKWNTLEGNLTKLVAEFIESEQRTDEAALRLVEMLKTESEPVVLSGHSLGGAILLKALELYPECPNLHSIILLGAAYPQDSHLSQLSNISPKHYALNYYSPVVDVVLQVSYYNAMKKIHLSKIC
jgi:alpha-beta hydrolase superfamily lysophospholipase